MEQGTLRLPIDDLLPEIKSALAAGRGAVIVAEPGAGKTTRVPLALLDEPWLAGRKIVMLEPRRLAARHAARYMARSLGESVGETVGYRVRADARVGPRTRIEVVTEGVLTRMLQEDPALSDAGLVIFDEFHERSLHADLGLALCLQARELFREDLRIIVMSATLEAGPVSALLGGAPVLASPGRSYPVETVYVRSARRPAGVAAGLGGPGFREAGIPASFWENDMVDVTMRALAEREGDALVFLPGMAEIRRVEERLREALAGRPVVVAPMHGSLPQDAQDRALAPAPPGIRKVVLSTSVAETSLTVEGIRIVVDSGWMRVARFSPRTGMTRLETVPVSRASADQRRGRAGRVAPGVCYRMWTEEEHARLAPVSTPEILEADLAGLALELAVWGVDDPGELAWLDPPPEAAWRQAKELLEMLGALDGGGRVTEHGRRMAALGVHPRLAHMMLAAAETGRARLACELAVLLGGRDVLRGEAARDADIRRRIEALRGKGDGADERALAAMREEARMLYRRLEEMRGKANTTNAGAGRGPGAETNGRGSFGDAGDCGILLAYAYPDRIGRRRPDGRYLLSGGRGAVLPDNQPLARAEFLVAADLDDAGADGLIRLAAPLEGDWTRALERFIRRETEVRWDAESRAVRARERLRIGAVTLREMPAPDPDPDAVAEALLAGVRESGLELLPWTRETRQFCLRAQFMRRFDPAWPDFSDEALLATLPEWLGPHTAGMRSAADLHRLDLRAALAFRLTWEQRRRLDEWAPTHLAVPSGSRLSVDYSDPEGPVLAVRLQELFGLAETPRIAGGRVPVTLHLLSPAMRPVQVTRDLASFWRTTYAGVRKELKGRYPKHDWPEDPLAAAPSRGPRGRR